MNYHKYIPQSVYDYRAIDNLKQLSDEELKPLIYHLLDCLEDPNWIIAGGVQSLLVQKQQLSIVAVMRKFHVDVVDAEIKCNVIHKIVGHWNWDNIEKVLPSIVRIAYEPTIYEKGDCLNLIAREFLQSFKEEKYVVGDNGEKILDYELSFGDLKYQYTSEEKRELRREKNGYEELIEKINSWLKEAFNEVEGVEAVRFYTPVTVMRHEPERKTPSEVISSAFDSTLHIETSIQDEAIVDKVLEKLAELKAVPQYISFSVIKGGQKPAERFCVILEEDISRKINEIIVTT